MKAAVKKFVALTLAAGMAFTAACFAGGTTAVAAHAPRGHCGSFYQELTQLVAQDGRNVSSGASVQSLRDRADCRVLVWADGPLELGGLEPETVLSHLSLHVLQFAGRARAQAAVDALSARGFAACLDQTWSSDGEYKAGAFRAAGQAASWGSEYSGLLDCGRRWAGTYQNQVTVAVLDSGIDFEHPYLKNRVNRALSVNLSWDENRLDDENGHGSHVAGIVANGTQDAPVTIVSVKTQDSQGNGTDAALAAGLLYSMEQGFDVCNLSLGGGHSAVVDAAIQDCIKKGIVVVTSAGNDGARIDSSQHCPAHMREAIVVGACDKNGSRCSFSNYGDSVDFLAPGQDINSCVPGGGWEEWSGTSMAAPIASGAAALLLCRAKLTPAQVEAALKGAVNEKGALDLRLLRPEQETPAPVPVPAPAPEPTPDPAPASTPDNGGYVVDQEYRYLGQTGLYTGQWSGGRPEGQGKMTFPGGGQFRWLEGAWSQGLFTQGAGEEPLSGGDTYTGGLIRVMRDESRCAVLWHGSGRFALASGDWTETVYDRGELVSTIYHTKDGQVFEF